MHQTKPLTDLDGLLSVVAATSGGLAIDEVAASMLGIARRTLKGNTYSLRATRRLFEAGGLAAGHSPLEYGCCSTTGRSASFTPALIRAWVALRFWACMPCCRTTCCPIRLRAGGRLLTRAVGVGQSPYTRPILPQLIDKAAGVGNAHEQAFSLVVQLPYLKPFENLNRRVSRLAANIPLLQQQLLCPLSFVDVLQDDHVKDLLGVYELVSSICCAMCLCGRVSGLPPAVPACASPSRASPFPPALPQRYLRGGGAGCSQAHLPRGCASAHPRLCADHSHRRARPLSAGRGTELLSLHDGNIARYRLRPSKFMAWHAIFHNAL